MSHDDIEFIDVRDAHTLLHQYSEWLDGGVPLDIKENPSATHEDLVKCFLAERSPNAIPYVGDPRQMAEAMFAGATAGPEPVVSGVLDEVNTAISLRLEALNAALRFGSPETRPEDVVAAANSYLKFLRPLGD